MKWVSTLLVLFSSLPAVSLESAEERVVAEPARMGGASLTRCVSSELR